MGGGAADGFFPFSAADIPPGAAAAGAGAAGAGIPPPSPAAAPATVVVRELAGRGIPSVAAVAPEMAADDGKK